MMQSISNERYTFTIGKLTKKAIWLTLSLITLIYVPKYIKYIADTLNIEVVELLKNGSSLITAFAFAFAVFQYIKSKREQTLTETLKRIDYYLEKIVGSCKERTGYSKSFAATQLYGEERRSQNFFNDLEVFLAPASNAMTLVVDEVININDEKSRKFAIQKIKDCLVLEYIPYVSKTIEAAVKNSGHATPEKKLYVEYAGALYDLRKQTTLSSEEGEPAWHSQHPSDEVHKVIFMNRKSIFQAPAATSAIEMLLNTSHIEPYVFMFNNIFKNQQLSKINSNLDISDSYDFFFAMLAGYILYCEYLVEERQSKCR